LAAASIRLFPVARAPAIATHVTFAARQFGGTSPRQYPHTSWVETTEQVGHGALGTAAGDWGAAGLADGGTLTWKVGLEETWYPRTNVACGCTVGSQLPTHTKVRGSWR
jgi:hypothetical protein